MRKKLATALMILLSGAFFTFPLLSNVQAQSDNVFEGVCQGVNSTICEENKKTGNQTTNDNRIYGPNGVLTRVARLLLNIVAIAATIMILISGFRYVLGSGDPAKVNSAKNTLIFAIVGLVVAVASQAIIVFVVNNVL